MSCCRVDWGLPLLQVDVCFLGCHLVPGGATISRPYISCTPAPHRTGQAAFPHPALHSNIQLQAKRVHVRFCLPTSPCSICAHSVLTPWIVSVFLLARTFECGTFHSTGISRFIATPGPVPLQRPHLNHSCYVAHAYSGPAAQEGLCTPGLLHDCCSTRCCLRPRGLVSHCP
jgi:hypothetical protein